jgi:FHA domain
VTYTCPEGHSSASGDYCDVCGAPISGAQQAAVPAAAAPAASTPYRNPLDLSGGAPPAPATPAAPAEQLCPNCAASNLPAALYCENCGYDFTTGQLPRPLDPPAGVSALQPSALPADLTPPPDASPDGASPAGPDADPAPATDALPDVAPDAGPAASTVPPVTPTSAPGHVEWVAEVWVDPDWYASQDVTEPCPSAGMPLVVPILDRTVLIGRLSSSRNIHPQIDLSSDNGVSRRHAQLNSDGQRWWVEDLQSANGTFVGAAGDPLPSTPIPVGQRIELADDDRIFVGAWTRVVVRKATPEESNLAP